MYQGRCPDGDPPPRQCHGAHQGDTRQGDTGYHASVERPHSRRNGVGNIFVSGRPVTLQVRHGQRYPYRSSYLQGASLFASRVLLLVDIEELDCQRPAGSRDQSSFGLRQPCLKDILGPKWDKGGQS